MSTIASIDRQIADLQTKRRQRAIEVVQQSFEQSGRNYFDPSYDATSKYLLAAPRFRRVFFDAMLLLACPTRLLSCREAKISKLPDTLDLRDGGQSQHHLLADNPYHVGHESDTDRQVVEDDQQADTSLDSLVQSAADNLAQRVEAAAGYGKSSYLKSSKGSDAIKTFRTSLGQSFKTFIENYVSSSPTTSPRGDADKVALARDLCETLSGSGAVRSMIMSRGQFRINVEVQRANQTQIGTRVVWYVAKGFSSQHIDVDKGIIPIPFIGFCLCMWGTSMPLIEHIAQGSTGQRSQDKTQSGILTVNIYLGSLASGAMYSMTENKHLKKLKRRIKNEIIKIFCLQDPKSLSKSQFKTQGKKSKESTPANSRLRRVRSLYEMLCFWRVGHLMSKDQVSRLIDKVVQSAYRLIDKQNAGQDFVREESETLLKQKEMCVSWASGMVNLMIDRVWSTKQEFFDSFKKIDRNLHLSIIEEVRLRIKKGSLEVRFRSAKSVKYVNTDDIKSELQKLEQEAKQGIKQSTDYDEVEPKENDVESEEEADDDDETKQYKSYEAFKKSTEFNRIMEEKVDMPAKQASLRDTDITKAVGNIIDDLAKSTGIQKTEFPRYELFNRVDKIYKSVESFSSKKIKETNDFVLDLWKTGSRKEVNMSGHNLSCGFHAVLSQIESKFEGDALTKFEKAKEAESDVKKMRTTIYDAYLSRKTNLEKSEKVIGSNLYLQDQIQKCNAQIEHMTSTGKMSDTFMFDTEMAQFIANNYGRKVVIFSRNNDKRVLNDIQINVPNEEDIVLQCSVEDFDCTIDAYISKLGTSEPTLKQKLYNLLDKKTAQSKATIRDLISCVIRDKNTICMISEPGHFRALQSIVSKT